MSRAPRGSEADAMLSLMCRSFGIDEVGARRIFYSDPFFDLGMKRVLPDAATDTLLSCLTLLPAALRLDPARILPVCGIAGVCTNPGYRRQGHAGDLLLQTVAHLARLGQFDIAALTAGQPGYYESLGWAPCGTMLQWTATARALTKPANSAPVREWPHVEIADRAQELHRVYTRVKSSAERGVFLRDERRWRVIETLTPGRRIAVCEDPVGGLLGYLAFDIRQPSGGTGPVVGIVHEIVAEDFSLQRALLGHMARSAGCDVLTGRCSRSQADGLRLTGVQELAIQEEPSVYMQVVHLSRLLQGLISECSAPRSLTTIVGGFEIVIERPGHVPSASEPLGNCAAHIWAERSSVRVAPGALHTRAAGVRIAGDAGAVTQLVTGYRSAAELTALKRLSISATETSSVYAICEDLFLPLDPQLALPDMF